MAAERATDGTGVWFTIGTAADAARVPRRSAFRWVAARLIPVRIIGARRCIEVGALRRFAASRREQRATTSGMAPMQATPHGETVAPPSFRLDEEIAALSEGLVAAQELAVALLARVAHLERLLGVSYT